MHDDTGRSATLEAPDWDALSPGDPITVVKLTPDGTEAARYPGLVVATIDEDRWVVVLATWTYRAIELDGLSFRPGDLLLEWFSPDHPFNAFAIFSPEGALRGWYANVTLPVFLRPGACRGAPVTLVWHDLYLDLVGLPNGDFAMRDADELEASSLALRDAALHERIVAAGRELERRFAARQVPFLDAAHLRQMLESPVERR